MSFMKRVLLRASWSWSIVITVSLLLIVCLQSHAQQSDGPNVPDATPRAYRLSISPEVDGQNFHGRAEIDFDLAKSAETLTMNAKGLSFEGAFLKAKSQVRAQVSSDDKSETVTFRLSRKVGQGRHTLVVTYSGHMW
jgi:peptidase M1-like protein